MTSKESINTVELRDEHIYPDEEVLKSVLGRSFNAFKALVEFYNQNEMTHEWRYYKDGKAWLCKVQKKKKPSSGCLPGKATYKLRFMFLLDC